MTTIAFDGKTLAADTLLTWHDQILSIPARKLRCLPDGSFVGVAGSMSSVCAVIMWMEQTGGDPAMVPVILPGQEWMMMHVRNGQLFLRSSQDPSPIAAGRLWAIGSGAKYAIGALLSGKTAREAVAIAARVDTMTGGDIDAIDGIGDAP